VSDGPVVVLAGGTGGAKLARGMLDVVGPTGLTVLANTGDDIEIYGAYVSPDPDLISFWLADRIDARGWGLQGDTFHVMDGLRELGVDVWFELGDRDLAIGLALTAALGIEATILPMSDRPVRTRVLADGRWWPLQDFLIRHRGQGEVRDVDFRGARAAAPTPETLAALASARAIVIGPSNPVISIGPILALPGVRQAIQESPAPVVAVSPLVAGEVLKGPTATFMRAAGWPVSSAGIAAAYDGLLDGLVCDQRTEELPVLETDVLIDTPQARRRLAEETLAFARALARSRS
jgi:LPPG:FO 2-phospho-L-lactate transferase